MFRDRENAGRTLAAALASKLEGESSRVFGLARGGVLVARPIAEAHHLPLEVLVACKVGAPGQPELAVGAVSENGGEYWDPWAIQALALDKSWCLAAGRRAAAEARRRVSRYRSKALRLDRTELALVVDDGIATGSTVLAALHGLRAAGVERLAVGTPVASREAVETLRHVTTWMVALEVPDPFLAVGSHYESFEPVSDEELLAALDART